MKEKKEIDFMKMSEKELKSHIRKNTKLSKQEKFQVFVGYLFIICLGYLVWHTFDQNQKLNDLQLKYDDINNRIEAIGITQEIIVEE